MDARFRGKMMEEPTDFSSLKEMERENRKTLIINAAERVFARKPFDQVTMRDIAEEAGITPTAIYRYFSDKQDLYAEAYIKSNNRLLEKLLTVVENSEDLNLETIAMTTIDHFVNEEQNLKMRAHFMIDDSLSDELLQKLTENTKFFVDKIEAHIKKFSNHPDTRVIALTFFAALNGVMLTFRKRPGKTKEDSMKVIRKETQIISDIFGNKLKTE
ncbi:MAG TPA: TetR/AcrR family transcriptional regulator [Deltaproteobacteria bacterium]|nr:TetR/AcrR family transcriptional regulator [Deltaproteobacteria bacterium]